MSTWWKKANGLVEKMVATSEKAVPVKKPNGETVPKLSEAERTEVQTATDAISNLKIQMAELQIAFDDRVAQMKQQIKTMTQARDARVMSLAEQRGIDFAAQGWELLPKTGEFVRK